MASAAAPAANPAPTAAAAPTPTAAAAPAVVAAVARVAHMGAPAIVRMLSSSRPQGHPAAGAGAAITPMLLLLLLRCRCCSCCCSRSRHHPPTFCPTLFAFTPPVCLCSPLLPPPACVCIRVPAPTCTRSPARSFVFIPTRSVVPIPIVHVSLIVAPSLLLVLVLPPLQCCRCCHRWGYVYAHPPRTCAPTFVLVVGAVVALVVTPSWAWFVSVSKT
jgi:hypothetical protein